MYLRLVQMNVDPRRSGEFSVKYTERIIPALAKTKGCLYAALALNVRSRNRAVSLSLWNSREDADAYEASGLFRELVDFSRPYFSESTGWQLRLSEDLHLEYGPVKEEPVVQAYVGTTEHTTPGAPAMASCGFLRIVSMRVQTGKVEEFTRLYREHVLVDLRHEQGCCGIQLAQGTADLHEFVSFTIWKSQDAAERYEASGRFGALRRVLQPTLSTLYQWKISQEKDPDRTAVTSEDMAVDAFVVLTSRWFSGVSAP